ncbi:hypothetical protein VOLCADRAFT_119327 [Volvox carteri f. nagariensis]|uniref:Protein kinase domain-containing protein n=1 Tax=Volvox carteri f. nagariensis TaxID=3068 RepID=D8UC98_VOLCA|nr:uncharacterized protein VOLCADRAFT_119327 [Volvox carteri f. nagariensis]EFJ42610.1 hypothetical protein VOLCADRAFT_119327 [Volvox carteri f. nagariensis]|eukprot:XP_002956261.1 hypothetical protein VOLCADRAFT_119327 [Volvox carteri f. nagariensis]
MCTAQIRLVQEYCDLGSLRDKLKTGAFLKLAPSAVVADGVLTPPSPPPSPSPPPPPAAAAATATAAATPPHSSPPSCVLASPPPHLRVVDLAAVLDTAIDVARALAHLHREGIIHADLKPGNVLLKGSTSDPRGFVAKVADFGLSMRLENNETHVSNAYHGTLLHGHVSRASDVYSFGILLYELYTGDVAFRSVPKALIGHAITKENLRPVFPPTGPLGAPFEYQLLACRCWESNPEIRPEFDFILEDLKRMRVRLCATVPDGGGGSIGNMGRLTPEAAGGGGGGGPTGFGFPSEAAPAVGRLWGLSAVVHSRQGLNYLVQTSQGIGAKPFFRECGGVGGVGEGSLESDRSLSYSNSTSMCSTDAVLTRPSHNVTGGAAATGAKDGGGGSVGPGVVQGFAGGSGLHGDVRTAPYPGCRDAPAQDEAAVDEEEAAAVVRSL